MNAHTALHETQGLDSGKINEARRRANAIRASNQSHPDRRTTVADSNAIKPPRVVARTKRGIPLYERTCRGCGKVSHVEKSRMEKMCHPCAQKERSTHGLSKHPLYKKLKNIEARCRYPTASHWEYYGGRGISVSECWLSDPASFVRWALDNGWRPGMEVDRIDPDGDYSPENCRIITHRQNSQTTRRIKTTRKQADETRRLLESGKSVKEAAEKAGVTYMVAWHIKNDEHVWR